MGFLGLGRVRRPLTRVRITAACGCVVVPVGRRSAGALVVITAGRQCPHVTHVGGARIGGDS